MSRSSWERHEVTSRNNHDRTIYRPGEIKEERDALAGPEHSGSLFMYELGAEPEGSCCESVTSSNLGVNCMYMVS